MKTRKKQIAVGLSAAIALIATATASAQDAGEGILEEVVVTGSNVARPADSPRQVVTLDQAQIQNEQSLSISEVFRDLSITQGNFNGSGGVTVATDNNNGSINLRGLGARATLTLLNGRRHTVGAIASGSDGFTTTDPNVLTPSIMLDRVEVLTDGASAIYGSDAVAGVVNLVTNNDFEGIRAEYSQNILDRSSDTEQVFNLMLGAQGERTGIVAGVEYVTRPESLTDDLLDYSRVTSGRLLGVGQPGSLRRAPNRRQSGPWQHDPLCEDSSIGGIESAGVIQPFGPGTRCFFRLTLNRTLVAETGRLVALTVANHEFENGIRAEFEVGGATSEYSNLLNTSPILGSPTFIPVDHPGLTAYAADGLLAPPAGTNYYRVLMRMRKPDAPNFNPTNDIEKRDNRFAANFSGEFAADYEWEATYARSRATYNRSGGNTVLDRLNNGLMGYGGAGCDLGSGGASGYGPDGLAGTADDSAADPGCSWYNPLGNQWSAQPGDATYNSQELLNFIWAAPTLAGVAELDTLDFLVRGNPSDLLGFAVGVQTRSQDFSQDYDLISNAGGFVFASFPVEDYSGTIQSDAVFGEVVLFPTDSLEFQLAVRSESYETGQSSTDPKVGFLWSPTDNFRVRGNWGTSFRIANPPQQFGATGGAGATIEIIPDGGTSAQDSAAGAFTRGNPNVQPEESENFSFGFALDITDRLSVGLNYWSFEFDNIIFRESPDIVAIEDIVADGIFGNDPRVRTVGDASFAVTPGANALQWAAAPGSGGSIDILAGFDLTYSNSDFLHTSGLDFDVNYFWDAFGGEFGVTFNGTQTLSYDIPGLAGTSFATVDGVGQTNLLNNGAPVAEMKGALRLSYASNNHFFQLTGRHTSGLRQDDITVPTDDSDFNTIDLLYTYDFETLLGTGPFSASLGVINALDQDPPVDGDELSTVQTRLYDPRGRVLRFTLSKTF